MLVSSNLLANVIFLENTKLSINKTINLFCSDLFKQLHERYTYILAIIKLEKKDRNKCAGV